MRQHLDGNAENRAVYEEEARREHERDNPRPGMVSKAGEYAAKVVAQTLNSGRPLDLTDDALLEELNGCGVVPRPNEIALIRAALIEEYLPKM